MTIIYVKEVLIMEFSDRLKEFRLNLNIKTKAAMAEKLGIARTLYSMLENGNREPSKDVLEKLFLLSNKPEEYWLYGVNENEYIEKRDDFKCLRDAINQLDEIGLLDPDKDFSDGVKEVIAAAALADITHILEKRKKRK